MFATFITNASGHATTYTSDSGKTQNIIMATRLSESSESSESLKRLRHARGELGSFSKGPDGRCDCATSNGHSVTLSDDERFGEDIK